MGWLSQTRLKNPMLLRRCMEYDPDPTHAQWYIDMTNAIKYGGSGNPSSTYTQVQSGVSPTETPASAQAAAVAESNAQTAARQAAQITLPQGLIPSYEDSVEISNYNNSVIQGGASSAQTAAANDAYARVTSPGYTPPTTQVYSQGQYLLNVSTGQKELFVPNIAGFALDPNAQYQSLGEFTSVNVTPYMTRSQSSQPQSASQYNPNSAAGIAASIVAGGGKVDPYLAGIASGQGYGTPSANVGSYAESRQIIPSYNPTPGGSMVTDVSGRTQYVPNPKSIVTKSDFYGRGLANESVFFRAYEGVSTGIIADGGNQLFSRVNPTTGEFETYEKLSGRNIFNQVGGGGIGAAQSGTITIGNDSNTNAVLNRNYGSFDPSTDNRAWDLERSFGNYKEVYNKSGSKTFTDLGADLYGGVGGVRISDFDLKLSSPGNPIKMVGSTTGGKTYQDPDPRAMSGQIISGWWGEALSGGDTNAKMNTRENPMLFQKDFQDVFVGAIGSGRQSLSTVGRNTTNVANLLNFEAFGADKQSANKGSFVGVDTLKNYGYDSTSGMARFVYNPIPTEIMIRPEPKERTTNPFKAIREDVVIPGSIVEDGKGGIYRTPQKTIKGGEEYYPQLDSPKFAFATEGETTDRMTMDQKRESWVNDRLANANTLERRTDKKNELDSYTEVWKDIQTWKIIPNPDPNAGKMPVNVYGKSGEDITTPPSGWETRGATAGSSGFPGFLPSERAYGNVTPVSIRTTVESNQPPEFKGNAYDVFNVLTGGGEVWNRAPKEPVGATVKLGGDYINLLKTAVGGFTGAQKAAEPTMNPMFGWTNLTSSNRAGIPDGGTDYSKYDKIQTIGGGNKTITDLRANLTEQQPWFESQYSNIEAANTTMNRLKVGNVSSTNEWLGDAATYSLLTKVNADRTLKVNEYTARNNQYSSDVALLNAMDEQNPQTTTTTYKPKQTNDPLKAIWQSEPQRVDIRNVAPGNTTPYNAAVAPASWFLSGVAAKQAEPIITKSADMLGMSGKTLLVGGVAGYGSAGIWSEIAATGTMTGGLTLGGAATVGAVAGGTFAYGLDYAGVLGVPSYKQMGIDAPSWMPGGSGKGFVQQAGYDYATTYSKLNPIWENEMNPKPLPVIESPGIADSYKGIEQTPAKQSLVEITQNPNPIGYTPRTPYYTGVELPTYKQPVATTSDTGSEYQNPYANWWDAPNKNNNSNKNPVAFPSDNVFYNPNPNPSSNQNANKNVFDNPNPNPNIFTNPNSVVNPFVNPNPNVNPNKYNFENPNPPQPPIPKVKIPKIPDLPRFNFGGFGSGQGSHGQQRSKEGWTEKIDIASSLWFFNAAPPRRASPRQKAVKQRQPTRQKAINLNSIMKAPKRGKKGGFW